MANLDMTWECRINRTDEIGVLANSLNSMSHNLSNTMMELETANQHLKQDMEHIDELNKQRQYFFATASHELKNSYHYYQRASGKYDYGDWKIQRYT